MNPLPDHPPPDSAPSDNPLPDSPRHDALREREPPGVTPTRREPVVVIGAGPAGLMAAEVIREAGLPVVVHDVMPSAARKFLLAGKGGLNITHSEPAALFVGRYGARRPQLEPMLASFGPDALRAWVHRLGIDTFVGSSGRVFPAEMKAAPTLRAWLHRLRAAGVVFRMRHRWLGWHPDGSLHFEGIDPVPACATVLALGGASWPRLGSDGAWVEPLRAAGVQIAPLLPANCGFDAGWSEHFAGRFAGHPVKAVTAWPQGSQGDARQGEFVITTGGIEGNLVYHHAASLRDRLLRGERSVMMLDLAPGRTVHRLVQELSRPRSGRSLSNHLRVRAGIDAVKAGLLRELIPAPLFDDPAALAAAIKACPLPLRAARPMAESISTAGGVSFDSMDAHLMLRARPGVFCAGEMLDWEAPTGGYLLTASFATGRTAGVGVVHWLAQRDAAVASAKL